MLDWAIIIPLAVIVFIAGCCVIAGYVQPGGDENEKAPR